MIVGIDASSWSNRRGYGRFTRGLRTALAGNAGPHEFFLVPDRQTAAMPGFPDSFPVVIAATRTSPTSAASAAGRRTLRELLS